MKPVHIKTATGLIAWFMRKCKFQGWTSFWNTIYITPTASNKVIKHELKHIEQINKDGRFLFTVKYVYWFIKYGYYNNPYEIEARAAANE